MEDNMVCRFRITVRRHYDGPKNELPAGLFFPVAADDGIGEFKEVGEGRILRVSLSEEAVAKLKYGYGQPDAAEAVKAFVNHQLGIGNSVQGWRALYNRYSADEVEQLPIS